MQGPGPLNKLVIDRNSSGASVDNPNYRRYEQGMIIIVLLEISFILLKILLFSSDFDKNFAEFSVFVGDEKFKKIEILISMHEPPEPYTLGRKE
jgi:hypothetical protein